MTKIVRGLLLFGMLAFVPLTLATDSSQVAELKKKLASLDAEKQKELDAIEQNLDAKIAALKTEAGQLKQVAADLDKQLAELSDKNGPLLKELDRLQQEREAIEKDFRAKIAKAEKSFSEVETVTKQEETEALAGGAKLINDSIVSQSLSIELVPKNGEYPLYRRAENYREEIARERSQEWADETQKKQRMLSLVEEVARFTVFEYSTTQDSVNEPVRVGDILSNSRSSNSREPLGMTVVTAVERAPYGQPFYEIQTMTFQQFPSALAKTSAAKQFVTLANKYIAQIAADELGRAKKAFDSTKEQCQLALRNWDYANGEKLEGLKNQAEPLTTQITRLGAKLATCSSDLATKESVIGKPRAMQREELRQAVISRYEKDKATLSGQLASAQAEVEAARKRWWHDLFEYVYLSAIAVAVLSGAICFHGLTNKCPSCKRMWAAEVLSRVVTGKSEGYDTVQERITHRDREGNMTGTSERPVQRHYVMTYYDEHRSCKFCGHKWVKARAKKSGG